MSRINLKNIPIGVLIISSFYAFGAFILLGGVFTDPIAISGIIARVHGFLPVMGIEIILFVAALALILAYGLVCLSRWGFILAMTYSIYMAIANLISSSNVITWPICPENRLYYGNFLFSALVIVYLLVARRHFFGDRIKNLRATSYPE